MPVVNHPAIGSIIAVDPIRSMASVSLIARSLPADSRDHVMFVLGVNINLRASDLLTLTRGNIDFGQSSIVVRERKTKKIRRIKMSVEIRTMLTEYCAGNGIFRREQLMFPSRKGKGVMTVSSLNHLVKKWCREVGLTGHYGSHTLRKTWAFLHYNVLGTDLALISKGLNHASIDTTYDYLGMNSEQIDAMYDKFIGGSA